MTSFVRENLLNFEAFFSDLKDAQTTNPGTDLQLTKVLYILTNLLMDVKHKNQHYGVIYALKVLARKFSPLNHGRVWQEFNVLAVLISFMNKNPGIALDISCQCDMLEVIGTLIGAGLSSPNVNEFLLHLLRILNIFGHLLSNTKPLLMPKQKSKDIFTSSKELATINSLGFFSSDHFYLKLYLVLKSSFESFRITINKDAEVKLKQLLHVTLKSLQTLLELRQITPDHVKLLEETVHYLNQLIAFQPEDCIVTTKILLKFLFQRNFVNRKLDLDALQSSAANNDAASVFEKFENFASFEIIRDITFDSSIKQFDPLVIQGLRMFSKSNARLQATILDMLCQLLEFNVNYMQLDAKKVFVDFVMRQLEYIESGLVMDGEILAPRIVQFLIYLTKLKDKKLITIPKIINIVDNLLAVATNCGVEALLVLTMELFFRRIVVKGEPDVIEVQNKEVNAQREVVVSMLLKFLHHKKIQDALVWVVIKSRVDPAIATVIDENEIHQQLVNVMKDNNAPASILGIISKNILLESKNFEAVLGLYWTLLESCNVKSIGTLTVIQEQVMAKAEEVYLVNHVKLRQEKRESDDDEPLKTFVQLHLKFLVKLCENCGKLEENTKKFWRFMLFKKFPAFLEVLKTSIDLKEITKISSTSLENFNIAINFLMTIDIEIKEIMTALNLLHSANKQKLVEIFYKNLFAKRNDINAWQNDELMNFFKDGERLEILLKFSQSVLLDSLLEDQKISKIIIRKLTMAKIPLERVKFLLENAHEESLLDSLNYVITKTAHDSKDSRILQLVMAKKLHSIKNEIIIDRDGLKPSAEDFQKLSAKFVDLKLHKKFPTFAKAIDDFESFLKAKCRKDVPEIDAGDLSHSIDESWLLAQAKTFVSGSANAANGPQIAMLLLDIKSESKLVSLLTPNDFNLKLLPSTISVAFEKMLKSFRIDCVQINPHLNYMKVPPLLKISILILMKNLEAGDEENVEQLAETLSIFLRFVRKLENIALIYVEARSVEKFIAENLLKFSFHEVIVNFLKILVAKDWTEITVNAIFDILNQNMCIDEEISENLVKRIYEKLQKTFIASEFATRYQHPPLFEELPSEFHEQVETFKRVIFIAKIQESYEDGEFDASPISSKSRVMIEKLLNISRPLLRTAKFYQFTITPYEILLSYRTGDDLLVPQSEGNLKLKQIPIEYLSDSELLERYVRRINRYGFTQRQEFEEVFMTLLVLLNQWNEMQDAEEQFNIKQLCLQTNVELIVSCFRHPTIGAAENSFFHFPRCEKIKLESIGLKKLHHIQETLESELNVLYRPNLERIGDGNNVISCTTFDMNQFALNYSWQMIESREEALSRNVTFYHEKCGIDFKSALQLIYDLMTQMIDENPVMVLPQLVKLVDVLDNVDQFKWINKKMLSLYDAIAGEDTISHQFIAYLLCRSAAILVPSMSELQQLQVIINKYLSCNQISVRNAALHGLLCLFESLCKTNTTMGGMSDEMKMLRNCIINYTSKNGIVFER